jgi:(p)ppGpp synthase/HD superfamily hydrolase
MLVAEATEGKDPNLVIAAFLHDAIEDQEVPRAVIADTFNEDVASLVAEVTDDKTLDKAARKQRQIEDAPKKTIRAKCIKLADKTSNLRDRPQPFSHVVSQTSIRIYNLGTGRRRGTQRCEPFFWRSTSMRQ